MRELFLISFNGIRYGVWKDKILAVRDIGDLHWIPLSPAHIAGIVVEEGQTVIVADLHACISDGHVTKTGQGSILLMKQGEKTTGFAVTGKPVVQPIPHELFSPLPDFLKTAVFDSCAVHDGIPVPVINIAELYSSVMMEGAEFSADPLRFSAAQPLEVSDIDRIRLFSCGGERYAVPTAGMEDRPLKPGAITPLPNTPQYVKGVACRDGKLLPVIDWSHYLGRQSEVTEPLMLMAKIGEDTFGLLVDSDEGALPAGKDAIKPAPPIVQHTWMKHMAVHQGEPVPLVDLALALSQPSGSDEKPAWQRYTADSDFAARFSRQDADVVEFSLLGERHALPKQEVQEVIACKSWRVAHDVPPIVVGVTEYDGEILPVLDLAMMFGRRSLATPAWRMMLVSNGDFRALVVTEAVYPERKLPVAIHRAVPIHLPHDLMYGCYPDEKAVRLILDIEAVAVYFENPLVEKFLPALSQEMKKVSAEAEPAHETAQSAAPETEPIAMPAASAAQGQIFDRGGDEWGNDELLEQESVPLAEDAPVQLAEEMIAPELAAAGHAPGGEHASQDEAPIASAQTTLEPQRHPVIEDVGYTHEDHTTAESAIINEPIADEAPPLSSQSGRQQKEQASEYEVPVDEILQGKPESPPDEAATDSMAGSIPPENISPEHIPSEHIVDEQYAEPPPDDEDDFSWKRVAAQCALGVMIIVVMHFAGTYLQLGGEAQTPESEQTVQAVVQPKQAEVEAPPVKTKAELENGESGQASMHAEEVRAEAALEKAGLEAKAQQANAIKQAEPVRRAEESRPPLELDIPKHMPTDIDVYQVVEGDTLWSISQRFTGNPFNYPRIAGENKIADPDLIFPGQRIRLIK